ncbi:MAG TPA: prolyl oligopeptidase family serine peptidase [Gemmatimonadaceae bacterium]|nr:prolyl oligopeptidase family serine peptidase [Gemmatimonadaceae bacterium]
MTRFSPTLRRAFFGGAGALAIALPVTLAAQNVVQQGWNPKEILANDKYVKPPEVVTRIVTASRNAVSFTNPSPDHRYFLKAESEGLSTIELFGKPHYRLSTGFEVDFKANRARALTTRGSVGLTLLDPNTGASRAIETPKGAIVNGAIWSPDGKSIAYIASFDASTQIYVADVATGKSVQVSTKPLLATRVTTIDWTDNGKGIATVLIPENRGPEPKEPPVATGPLIRFSSADTAKVNRNYQSLLQDQTDFDLVDYYTNGQLAVIDVKTKAIKKIGAPALITDVNASPDGQYFRVTLQSKPYSFLVPVSNFGTVEQLWDANGKVIATLAKRALNDGQRNITDSARAAGGGRGGVAADTGKRDIQWNPMGAGLVYLEGERAAGNGGGANGARGGRGGRGQGGQGGAALGKDRVYLWTPPFGASDAKQVFEANGRITSALFSPDGKMLFVNEGNNLYAVKLDDPSKHYEIARGATIAAGGRGRGGFAGGGGRGGNQSDSAFFNNPGALQTTRSANGQTVVRVSSDDKSVFLEGTQYFRDWTRQAPHNFVDRVDIETGAKTRIFEGKGDVQEDVVSPVDNDYNKVIVSKQSPTMVPDSYLRDLKTGTETKLTKNVDFAPEVSQAIRKRILVTRPRDGYKFFIDVTLPKDYREGTRLPGIIWFYPTEFTTQQEYDQRQRTKNINAFPNVAARSPEIWVTQGYVVIQPVDIPIVGPQGRMNDHYVDELREDLDLTIEAVDKAGYLDKDRLGIGGHSYGAFSTMNAMTHTPYFKAGIAGDGMYNRTLTPNGFQNERRTIWEGRDTYIDMSPFLAADRLSGAVLMYHSLEDQNNGTDLTSSVRMMQALQGLGKNAALYMYPYEDHGPATRETDLDQWARWIAWFDVYVKNPAKKPQQATDLVP